MDGPNSSQSVFHFCYKTSIDHARALLRFWKPWVSVAVAVFSCLWLILQVPIHFLELEIGGWPLYIIMVLASLTSASIWVLHHYINSAPHGFEKESKAAKRIAQIQRPKWEFRLARQLLREKLSNLDKQLEDLLCGRVFVPVKRPNDVIAYMHWLEVRPANLIRMVDVAKHLLTIDLPAAVQSTPDRVAVPEEIVEVTNRIRSLYAQTLAFEREGRAVIPPKRFQSVHQLQLGWAGPIRDGIQQVFTFFDAIVGVDLNRVHSMSLNIVFENPPGIDKFCQELNRLTAHLPEILADGEDLAS